MSSYTVTVVDRDTIPTELLPKLKKHCRVDFDDDDEVMTMYLQWAVDYRERFTGLTIFYTEATWSPDGASSRERSPMQPLDSDVIAEYPDPDTGIPVDVSAAYAVEHASLTEPWWVVRSD